MIRHLAIAVVTLVMVVGAENVLARGGARGGGGASRGGASRGGGGGAARGGGFGGGMPMDGGGFGGVGGGRGGPTAARGGGASAGFGAGARGGPAGGFGGASGGRGAAAGPFGGGATGTRGSGASGRFGGAAGGAATRGAAGLTGGFQRAAAPTTSQMNQFLGLPSDGGMSSSNSPSRSFASGAGGPGGNFDVQHGAVEGPRGGVAGGTAITGPNDNTVARGAAVGPDGGVVAGRGIAGAGGGSFAQGAAVGPNGGVAAGEVARGPNGDVAARGGYAYAAPSARYGQAYAVRGDFTGGNLYTPAWYTAHPGAWFDAGIAAGAWSAASWNSLNGWCGVAAPPVDYNYGSTVVTQDNSVYVDGQPAGTTEEYYQQASDLAQTGAQAPATDDEQWLPLGVFAMSREGTTGSNMVIQLAVNKQGVIRGNFTDTKSNQTLAVQGSIDKQSQRAAWTIGDKTANVMETGLYNLTKDEVPALLHYGSERSEQWLLVRVTQGDQAAN